MSAQEGSLCPFVKNEKPVLQSIQWNIFSYITETMTKTIWSYPYQVLLISNLHIHEYQTELKIIAKWQTLSFVCHSINDLENSFYKLSWHMVQMIGRHAQQVDRVPDRLELILGLLQRFEKSFEIFDTIYLKLLSLNNVSYLAISYNKVWGCAWAEFRRGNKPNRN